MRLLSQKLQKGSFTLLLLLLLLPFSMVAQTKSVSGVVKDGKGDPVANVTVSVKGTKTAVRCISDRIRDTEPRGRRRVLPMPFLTVRLQTAVVAALFNHSLPDAHNEPQRPIASAPSGV